MYTRMKWMVMTAAMVLSVAPGWGQEGNFRKILRFEVKPDMLSEFTAAVKADKEAMTKAGYKRAQTWWRATTGSNDVILVRYYKSYADMEQTENPDSAVSLARARVMRCASSYDTTVDEIIPEASTVVDRSKLPQYLRALRSTVKPDRVADFAKWVREEVGPVVKKGNFPLFLNSQVRYGKTVNQFLSVAGMASLAEFDGPVGVAKAMSKADYAALLAKYQAMITHSEITIYRAMPDLNYLPQK
jgi:hypothetical protein